MPTTKSPLDRMIRWLNKRDRGLRDSLRGVWRCADCGAKARYHASDLYYRPVCKGCGCRMWNPSDEQSERQDRSNGEVRAMHSKVNRKYGIKRLDGRGQ